MPMPNYHSGRQRDPGDFKKGAMKDGADFDTITLGKGITAIIGKLKTPPKGSKAGATTVQTYRFDKTKFSAKQAKEWLKSHGKNVSNFEAAKGEVTVKKLNQAFNEVMIHGGSLFNKAELQAKYKDSVVVMNYEQQMRFIDTIHGLGQIRTNNPKIDESIARHAWALNDLFNELQPPKI
jgi:hypothetical protein